MSRQLVSSCDAMPCNVGQVQGFIKTGVCRGATYLEMAPGAQGSRIPKLVLMPHALGRLKLTLPQPLNMEVGSTRHDRAVTS